MAVLVNAATRTEPPSDVYKRQAFTSHSEGFEFMDIVLMILYATIVLGILVFIHEGGHYLASRAFGVRVTEFMLGLPGPSIGFTKGGTKFGVTPFLLGGYAKVCGMEPGEMSPHLEAALASLYRRGTANMEDIARDCGISDDAVSYTHLDVYKRQVQREDRAPFGRQLRSYGSRSTTHNR